MQRVMLLAALLLLLTVPALAQSSGGQICVRAYEDRNGNQTQDPGEPPITRGISAALADVEGVIVQSLLLEDSPRAPQGIVCFQGLAGGQYSVTIASADYRATTPITYVTSISETSVPVPFDFGAQQVVSTAEPVRQPGSLNLTAGAQRALLERVFFASLGAVVVLGLMTVVGAVLYLLFFRVPAQPARRTTGQMYAVSGTGGYPPVPGYPPPTPGSPMRPVDPATGYLRPPAVPPLPPAAPALDDTGPSKPVNIAPPVFDEPLLNPDDDTGRYRPSAGD
ncbi:MAG: hypothetical protein MUE40_02310 [Anaerolineae bacterium]|nr:hypothetical protein [Anaerolineae bacterium]